MAQKLPFSASLNAARFGVSLLVVLAHVAAPPLAAAGAPAWTIWFLNSRSLSSTFFFLLSGFILTASLFHRTKSPKPFPFFLQRVARLWPVHALAFLAMLPTAFIGSQQFALSQILTHSAAWLSMAHGFLPGVVLLYNTPAWAVTSFALGYLAVGCILAARDWPVARIVAAMVALWFLVVAAQSAGMSLYSPQWTYQILQANPMSPEASWMQIFLHTTPLLRVPEIAIGSFAGLLACRPACSNAWPRWPWDSLAAATAAAIAGLMLWIGAQDDRLLYLATHGLLTPLCLCSIYSMWRSREWMERFCSHPFLMQGGRSAILIYFVHLPVFRTLQWFWSNLAGVSRREAEANPLVLAIGLILLLVLTFRLERAYGRWCDAFHRLLSPSAAARVARKARVVPCMQ